jgi:ElaB/YqjD/DUF883 family membrane-anchored ribosome-binding protein
LLYFIKNVAGVEEGMTQDKRKKNAVEGEESIKDIIEEVTAKGKALLSDGLEEAREIFDEKKEYLREKASELKDKKVSEVAADVKEFVKENPWTSVGIALGLGLLLGKILKSDD